jgi:hypothetical protein
MHKKAILCVDDELIVTGALRTFLANNLKEDLIIEIAQSADEALD